MHEGLRPLSGGKGEGVPAPIFDVVARPGVAAQEPEKRFVPTDARLPTFFIVGPPRTGSSWLHKVLSSHAILPHPAKETRFFDQHFQRGLKWYLSHYNRGGDERKGALRTGEVAPTYFASATARERIYQTVPEAKIVCVFRNPAERIISLYRLKRAYGLIPWSLEEALERDPELTETSRYASNLRLWQMAFGAAQVRAAFYDDLRATPQRFLDEVMDFIEIPRFALNGKQFAAVHDSDEMTQPRSYYRTRSATLAADWFKARRMDRLVSAFRRSPLLKFVLGGGQPFQKISESLVAGIYEKFRTEVEDLEELSGRDLSHWKYAKGGAARRHSA